jgi:hypothetical protein
MIDLREEIGSEIEGGFRRLRRTERGGALEVSARTSDWRQKFEPCLRWFGQKIDWVSDRVYKAPKVFGVLMTTSASSFNYIVLTQGVDSWVWASTALTVGSVVFSLILVGLVSYQRLKNNIIANGKFYKVQREQAKKSLIPLGVLDTKGKPIDNPAIRSYLSADLYARFLVDQKYLNYGVVLDEAAELKNTLLTVFSTLSVTAYAIALGYYRSAYPDEFVLSCVRTQWLIGVGIALFVSICAYYYHSSKQLSKLEDKHKELRQHMFGLVHSLGKIQGLQAVHANMLRSQSTQSSDSELKHTATVAPEVTDRQALNEGVGHKMAGAGVFARRRSGGATGKQEEHHDVLTDAHHPNPT